MNYEDVQACRCRTPRHTSTTQGNTHTLTPSHTDNLTHADTPTDLGSRKLRRRFARLVAGGGVAALALALNAPVASSVAPSTAHVDLSGVASWAVANNVSGLSPAGMQTVSGPHRDTSALSEWAIENGLTGLSPASLRVIGE